jgi:hypothetical protein
MDKQRWNALVAKDSESLIYQYTWFLEAMCDSWYGIIDDQYTTVIPLAVKRKWGIKHVYMPPFLQRMMLVGKALNEVETKLVNSILQNFSSLTVFNIANFELNITPIKNLKNNFFLDLQQGYKCVYERYTKELIKNVKKAHFRGCEFTTEVTFDQVVAFYQQAYGEKSSYTSAHFALLKKCIEQPEAQGYFHLWGVKAADTQELLLAALLLDDGRRCYYLLAAPSAQGKQYRATAFFIDTVIQKMVEKGNRYFDFEGSNIPSVAQFYRTFNPETEHYTQYYYNGFCTPLKQLLDWKLSPNR